MRTIAIIFLMCGALCWMEVHSVYANKFFHGATIDQIRSESIVIDEREHRLSPLVRFYSANNIEIGRGAFAKGQKINFELNEKNELISVWQYAPPRE